MQMDASKVKRRRDKKVRLFSALVVPWCIYVQQHIHSLFASAQVMNPQPTLCLSDAAMSSWSSTHRRSQYPPPTSPSPPALDTAAASAPPGERAVLPWKRECENTSHRRTCSSLECSSVHSSWAVRTASVSLGQQGQHAVGSMRYIHGTHATNLGQPGQQALAD
jgi:hypothetical protein